MKEIAKQLSVHIIHGRELFRIKLHRFLLNGSSELLIDIKVDSLEDYWHGFVVDGAEYDLNIWTESDGTIIASMYETEVDDAGFTNTLTDKWERIETTFI